METTITPDMNNTRINLVEMVEWAEAHPEQVREIVENARTFAEVHLSELAQTCYMARLLIKYVALFSLV